MLTLRLLVGIGRQRRNRTNAIKFAGHNSATEKSYDQTERDIFLMFRGNLATATGPVSFVEFLVAAVAAGPPSLVI